MSFYEFWAVWTQYKVANLTVQWCGWVDNFIKFAGNFIKM